MENSTLDRGQVQVNVLKQCLLEQKPLRLGDQPDNRTGQIFFSKKDNRIRKDVQYFWTPSFNKIMGGDTAL